MSVNKRVCMLSNTPIYEGDSVKLFFLVSSTGYRDIPVFSRPVFGPFDNSKILGGISINAIYNNYDEYEIIQDIKSDYLLSIFRKDNDNKDLSYSDVLKKIDKGGFKINCCTSEQAFISIGLIHNDLYYEMIDYHKEEHLSKFQHRFYEYLRFRDMDARAIHKRCSDEEYDKIKDKEHFEVNGIDLYTFKVLSIPGMRPFAELKELNSFKDQETFELLLDDMMMMDIFIRCGIMLKPSNFTQAHSGDGLMRKLLHCSYEHLYNHEECFYKRDYMPKYNVSVVQEVHLKDLKNIMDEENVEEMETFIKRNQGLKSIIIQPQFFNEIEWVLSYIDDEDIPVKMFF